MSDVAPAGAAASHKRFIGRRGASPTGTICSAARADHPAELATPPVLRTASQVCERQSPRRRWGLPVSQKSERTVAVNSSHAADGWRKSASISRAKISTAHPGNQFRSYGRSQAIKGSRLRNASRPRTTAVVSCRTSSPSRDDFRSRLTMKRPSLTVLARQYRVMQLRRGRSAVWLPPSPSASLWSRLVEFARTRGRLGPCGGVLPHRAAVGRRWW